MDENLNFLQLSCFLSKQRGVRGAFLANLAVLAGASITFISCRMHHEAFKKHHRARFLISTFRNRARAGEGEGRERLNEEAWMSETKNMS
jgi:hypothetical protein